MVDEGYQLFHSDKAVAAWAAAAHRVACDVLADPTTRHAQLRHGETWFVGVDTLPNAADGSVGGIPLDGPWKAYVTVPNVWHAAQASVVYPGYPGQDKEESDANHRYRITRHAAHVDGLLPVGSDRRRFLQEPHAFVLGLPLNCSDASPLMVWPGSHQIMGAAFRKAVAADDPSQVDLTESYHAARRQCFDTIEPRAVHMTPGQSILLHRHLMHGVAPWAEGASAPSEGRMVAYFRPQFSANAWLAPDRGPPQF